MTRAARSVLARVLCVGAVSCFMLATPRMALADEPRAEVRGDLDGDLRERVVRAVGEVRSSPENRFQARRNARQAAENAEAVLRSEGYYQAVIEADVEGDDQPRAIIIVTPGPRFALTRPEIQWLEGEPAPEIARQASEVIALEPGEPGRAADVIAAEGRIVALLTRSGHADARAEDRRVVVDHAETSVEPTYRITAGPLVRLDGIRLVTRGPTRADWVAGLAPWEEGQVYDPEAVAELERRLLETGVYDTVGVALARPEQTTPEGLRPVIITLRDRPARVLEAGVTLSTAEGAGIDGTWTWYNRFGRADTLRFAARAAEIDSRLGVTLSIPHWTRPGRTLSLGTALVFENTDAYDRLALNVAADVNQRIGRTSYAAVGVSLDGGRYNERRFVDELNPLVDLTRDLAIVTGRATAYMDRANDLLDPSTGYRALVSVQPTYVTGDVNATFVRTEITLSAYYPVQTSPRTIVAGRLKVGSILGADELDVPGDRLFFSGGGGSVRGYDFQGVGPRLIDNTPRGGLSVVETSIEVRRDFGRNFGGVVFLDGGSVRPSSTPGVDDMRWGAGVGVRYRLPFGPVRADIAVPIDRREGDPNFQIYISVGQAF